MATSDEEKGYWEPESKGGKRIAIAVLVLVFSVLVLIALVIVVKQTEDPAKAAKDRQEMAAKMHQTFELADIDVSVQAKGSKSDVLVIDGTRVRKADLRLHELTSDGKLHADLWVRGFRELRIEYSESGTPKSITVDLMH